MPLFTRKKVPEEWSNVEIFTFGQSSIYGYDCSNHCILISSMNDERNNSIHRCHLSSSPTWPIRQLILNPDETIIALVAKKLVYLVQLSSSNIPNGKTSDLCRIIRVGHSSSKQFNVVIDFLWLTSKHFLMVNSIPSSSQCDLYAIRSFTEDRVDFVRTYSVGIALNGRGGKSSKKISLHQPSDIVHLSEIKRKESDRIIFRILATKSDGEIYLLQINETDLQSNETCLVEEFEGPLRYLPSSFDNYGCDHTHSLLIPLTNDHQSIIVFTRNRFELDQCLILSKYSGEHYLFAIDSIQFDDDRRITQMINDRFSSNRSYLVDHRSNVYLVEFPWIDQIENPSIKTFSSTNIQPLMINNNPNQTILHLGILRQNPRQTSLILLLQSDNNQRDKEFIYLPTSTFDDEMNRSIFLNQLRSTLQREKSIPRLTISSKSSEEISNDDWMKNLSTFIDIFTSEYSKRQLNAIELIRSKENYLSKLRETQRNQFEQLKKKYSQVNEIYQKVIEEYQRELKRRNRLKSNFDDLLSMIEQNLPILSEKEVRMKSNLDKYQIQLNFFKENFSRLEHFLSIDDEKNSKTKENQSNLSLQSIQDQIERFQNEIQQLKHSFHKD